jgi:hypothetical protein
MSKKVNTTEIRNPCIAPLLALNAKSGFLYKNKKNNINPTIGNNSPKKYHPIDALDISISLKFIF